jgi:hypothetical protein
MSDYLRIARDVMWQRRRVLKPQHAPSQAVLKGRALELWSDALGEHFWLVADEEDACCWVDLAAPSIPLLKRAA